MNKYKNKIAITTGDINGIGLEITTKALNILDLPVEDIVLITNKDVLAKDYRLNKEYEIIDVPFNGKLEYGKLSKESGDFSFNCLKKACEICPKAIVTAPVSKEALYLAGHNYNGQTEVLEHFLAHDSQKAEMLFVSNGFNVFLVTRHNSLKDIPSLITKSVLVSKIRRLDTHFKTFFKIKSPKFALCSINPHAGEGGILGDEEKKVLIPAVGELRELGIDVTNPLPSDTLFVGGVQNYLNNKKLPYDCYIAMYHDQGLIPIKSVAGARTVNMTIGLDIIRTSPSHGTAFDIAGKNIANYDSMVEAIKTVVSI